MPDKADWDGRVRNLLKSELKLKGLTYADLVQKLAEMGVPEKEVNVRNKLMRGRFSAVFLAQCLTAIGSDRLRLD